MESRDVAHGGKISMLLEASHQIRRQRRRGTACYSLWRNPWEAGARLLLDPAPVAASPPMLAGCDSDSRLYLIRRT